MRNIIPLFSDLFGIWRDLACWSIIPRAVCSFDYVMDFAVVVSCLGKFRVLLLEMALRLGTYIHTADTTTLC